MSSEPFVGEIMMWGGSYAPEGWAFCDGQLMSISQNCALFSLIGTMYGGNGWTTFALPDLRGRMPLGLDTRTSAGYADRPPGGQESVTFATQAVDTVDSDGVTVAVLPSDGKVDTMPPCQGVSFVISLYGDYPPRP